MKNLLKVTLLTAIIVLFKTGLVFPQSFTSVTNLTSLSVSAITGEKPQSKVWTYAGRWWMVMPNSSGTQIWRLDGITWTSVLNISASTATYADCKANGNVTHILLYQGTSSSLVSVEYVPATHTYQLWTTRASAVPITLDAGVETATIDMDGTGRMWLANAGTTEVHVRWSDSPYSTWSSPISIASGINDDDICAVTAFNGRIGVIWSNQNTQRFGFKYHVDGADPATWSADEVPASQSALNVGGGMADDHLNVKVASDGTLYAAVKTSYDVAGNPRIALLIRRPAGTWDNIYSIDEGGTRGIVALNEATGKVQVIFTASDAGGNIMYRESSTSNISFGSTNTLITGGTYNNATSTKQNYSNEVVIVASNGSSALGVLGSNGSFALNFDGTNAASTTDYVNCGTSVPADITGAITLEAWVRSDGRGTQSIIKKNGSGPLSGYELSLSNNEAIPPNLPQNFFFRLNGDDLYRVNSTSWYPIDGRWAHVAATYDGSVMKLYVNGVQEGGNVAGPASITTNSNNVVIGTDAAAIATKSFNGGIDEVRIWNVARTSQEILDNYQKEITSGTGLVARYGMNEGTGTTTVNSTGGGLNGTLMDGTAVGNGPLWVPGAPFSTLVATPAPAAPTLLSPANTATGIAVSPTLSWNASSGATTYQVQVSTLSDFSTFAFNQSGIGTTSALVTPSLLNNTLYYWRVNASNSGGTSAWSSPSWSFTTFASAPTIQDNGAGYALDFDGTDDYVNAGNNASVQISGTAITMEAWIKPTKVAGTMSILKKTGAVGAGTGYELYCGSAGYVYCRFNGLDASRAISTTPYPTDGRWMHVAATYNGINTKMYINGVLEGTTAYTAAIVNSTNALTIAQDLSTTLKLFQGSIDEVRLWNIARSDADIKANMTKKLVGNESGLVGYWRMDETTLTNVNDETSNNNDGTMTNMDPLTDHIWSGAALGDAAANDYLAAGGYTATLNHANGDALTATTTGGTITGIQVYRADDNALRTGSTGLAGYTLDPLRFWGVRAIGTATPTYTLVYNYSGNPAVVNETGLKLVKRNDISVAAWTDALATLNTTAKTLTVTGATGTEYALAIPLPYQLTVTSTTGGTISAPVSSPVTVNHGVATTITAVATTGYTFTGWTVVTGSGTIATPSALSTTVTLTSGDAAVRANFAVAVPYGLQFDGVNDYVTFGQATSTLGATRFTLEAWVNRSATGGVAVSTGSLGFDGAGGRPNGAYPVLTKGSAQAETPANLNMNYFLGITSTGVIGADFEDNAGGVNHPAWGVTTITTGVWHHIAATYDGQTWRLYLDGNLDQTTTLTSAFTPEATSIQHAGLATCLTSTPAPNGYFAGSIDEARVWNYARTISEIRTTINSEVTSETGLLGRWGLNDGSGTTATNSVAGSPAGTLSGTVPLATWVTPGAPFNITFTSAAPSNLTSIPLPDNKIKVDWTDNSSNETGFEIERSTTGSGGVFTLLTTVAANVVTYTDQSLSAGMEYCYRVRSINGFGPSNYTNISCATAQLIPNNALDLGAGTGYVTFGNNAALGLSNITLECWFRRDGTGTTSNTGTGGVIAIPLVTKGRGEAEASNVDMNYFLGIRGTDNVLSADFEEGAGGATPGLNHPVFGTTPIVNNIWYHAAATYDGTTWYLYLNGILEGQLTVGQPLRSDCIQWAGLGTAMNSTGVTEGHFDGVIDEARIWNYARSQSEIQNTINSLLSSGETGLVARWGLDEGTGTAVSSTVIPAINGIIQNSGWSWVNPGAPLNLSFSYPAAPTNLTAVLSTPVSVKLDWVDNSGNETGFVIERSTTGTAGTYTVLTTVPSNTITYTDPNLGALTQYCYRVRARNVSGYSGYAGPVCITTGEIFSALQLTTNSYVTFGAAPSLATQNFTVEAWFRRTGTGTPNTTGSGGIDIIPILSKGAPEADGSTVDANYMLGINTSGNVIAADFEEGTGSASPGLNHPISGTTVIQNDIWYHAAATFSNGVFSVYLNGILENSLNLGVNVWPQGASIQHSALGTMITSGGAALGYFAGTINEARIWNYARNASELGSTINSKITSAQPGLLARWALNEGTGTVITGSAGTSVNGTITGSGYSWATPGAPFNISFTMPEAPTNLTVTPVSSSVIQLSWTDNSANESGFEIERSTTGSGGPYTYLATVPANTVTYSNSGLTPSTSYCYRVRAINAGGSSDYSNTACESTSGGPTTVSFQEGVNGYTGTVDNYIFSAPTEVNTSYGTDVQVQWDGSDLPSGQTVAGEQDALIRFDNIFGPGPDQIPVGSVIVSAILYYEVFDTGNEANVYNVLDNTWSEATTWNNFGSSAGIQQDVDYASSPLVATTTGSSTSGVKSIDVTSSIAAWVSDPATNHGWLFRPTGNSGVGFRSSEYATITSRPLLRIEYQGNPPDQPVPVAPLNNATGVSVSPTLQVTVSDPKSEAMTVRFYGRPKLAAQSPQPDFTIAALPDAQNYTAGLNNGTPAIFNAQTTWIVNQLSSRNIAYVAMEGDITNDNNDAQWNIAVTAMSILENAGIPYGISIGNHDGAPDVTSLYNETAHFGADRFTGRAYYQGHYGTDNNNNYAFFSAGGMDFIVINLGFGTVTPATDDVINWANGLLQNNLTRRAIVVNHNLLTGNSWSGPGQYIYDKLKGNPNLFMMLCGHLDTEYMRTDTFNGNTVYTILSDYQGQANGGNGWLRLFTFSPANNNITISSYSPTIPQTNYYNPIVLPYSMSPVNNYQLIGTNTGVASGTTTGISWPSLENSAEYEWYVTVSNSTGTRTGPAWSFTTAAPVIHYNINATAGSGGSISPAGLVDVTSGTNSTFTITPNPLYYIASVIVDGIPVATTSSYTFNNVTASHTIAATFAAMPNIALNKPSTSQSNQTGRESTFANDTDGTNNSYWSASPYSKWWKVDLGAIYDLSSIVVRNYVDGSRYYQYFVQVSTDDIIYSQVASKVNRNAATDAGDTYSLKVTARFIRVNMTYSSVSMGVNITDFRAYGIPTAGLPSFTLTSSSGPNGTITPSGDVMVNQGTKQTYSITPNSGYQIANVIVDGVPVGTVSTYTFNYVTANHTIAATFSQLSTYTITASIDASGGGTITPTGATIVYQETSQTYTITPNSGYQIATMTVDGFPVNPVGSYTFYNITSDHSISASFVRVNTIYARAGIEGTISPSDEVLVPENGNQTFNITASSGFEISDVLVDGESVGAVSTYTFNEVTTEHSILALFTPIYSIFARAGLNGIISPSDEVLVSQGRSQLFTITPDEGFLVEDVVVDEVSVGAVLSYTFSNVSDNHSILVTFSFFSGTKGRSLSTDGMKQAAITDINPGAIQDSIILNLYPNPFNEQLTIRIDSPVDEMCDIAITAITGGAVYLSTKIPANVETTIYPKLSPGMYIFTVNNKERKIIRRIVKY